MNESDAEHLQYFYVDHEQLDAPPEGSGYFHAEFRRANLFGGWGHEIEVNHPEANIVNKGRDAWDHNYVILDTRGCDYHDLHRAINSLRSYAPRHGV